MWATPRRVFDDLADDLAASRWLEPPYLGGDGPQPEGGGCRWVSMSAGKRWPSSRSIPRTLDWAFTREALFQDLDILELFAAWLDGIERLDNDDNRPRYGNYRPGTWAPPSATCRPCDGGRPETSGGQPQQEVLGMFCTRARPTR